MLISRRLRPGRLTCLLLALSVFISPLAGAGAQFTRAAVHQGTARQAAAELKMLSQYGVDLTELAQRGQLAPTGDYEAAIKQALRILAREKKNNPVLLGEEVADRTLIVEGIAQRIADGSAPANLLNKRVFNLNLESLSAGAHDSEEFNSRLEALLSEAKRVEGGVILFIDGFENLIGEDNSGNAAAVNLLEAAIARDEVRLVGGAAPESFNQRVTHCEEFKERLQVLFIEAASDDTAKASGEKGEGDEGARINGQAFVGEKSTAASRRRPAPTT